MDPVQEQLAAFNDRDVDRFVAAYAADVVIEDGAGQPLLQGHEGVRGFYGPLFAQSPALHAEVVTRIAVGAYVIDEERTTGFHATGFPSEVHSAVIYRVSEGKIAWVRILM